MPKITAFYAPWCGNCEAILPKVKAYAKRNGMAFEKIDVDRCGTDQCDSIEYVPSILVDGRPMSDALLEKIIDGS